MGTQEEIQLKVDLFIAYLPHVGDKTISEAAVAMQAIYEMVGLTCYTGMIDNVKTIMNKMD